MRAFLAISLVVVVALFSVGGGGGCGSEPSSKSATVASTVPEDGATAVPLKQVITVVFNQDVDETTLTSQNVQLLDQDAGDVPGAIAYDVPTRTLTFTPDALLTVGMLYTFTISANVTKKAPGDFSISFTAMVPPLLYAQTEDRNAEPYNIWSMLPDGSEKTNLTSFADKDEGSFRYFLAWSPDFTQIAYVADEGDPTDRSNLFVMNTDGFDRIDLSKGGAHYKAFFPVWSADGSRIFFVFIEDDTDPNAPLQIGSVKPDGSERMNLTNFPAGETVAIPLFTYCPENDTIFYAAGAIATEDAEIYALSTDGSSNVKITAVGSGDKDLSPLCVPNAERLVYVHDSSADGPSIMVMNQDGTDAQVLVAPDPDHEEITLWGFMPEGRQFAATMYRTVGIERFADLFLVDSDDGTLAPLTASAAGMSGLAASWSPRGTKLAYLYGDVLNGPLDLFVADPDGGNPINVTAYAVDMAAFDGALWRFGWGAGRFSPDNAQIAYTERNIATEAFNVMIANTDGSGMTPLTAAVPPASSILMSWW